jgi:hypothetical protein
MYTAGLVVQISGSDLYSGTAIMRKIHENYIPRLWNVRGNKMREEG